MIKQIAAGLIFFSTFAYAVVETYCRPNDGSTFMPKVNTALNIPQAVGFDTLRVKPTTEIPPKTGGAFRVVCTPSHMSNDDPLVFPNQKGAAHTHTFFGNTSTNYASDLSNMSATGNSTCKGGLINRSAYWAPSMIDTSINKAIAPDLAIMYYKTGYVPAGLVNAPPKGLRILAGNPKATTEAQSSEVGYTCLSRTPFYGWKKSIPNCNVGENMQMKVSFPQCWDGLNLDSPNHQDHMAYSKLSYTTANKCPTTHPIGIPQISINMNFKVLTANSAKNWRLASDNYSSIFAGGNSGHADWVSGWNQAFIQGFVDNCLNKGVDCKAHLLGDGRMIY